MRKAKKRSQSQLLKHVTAMTLAALEKKFELKGRGTRRMKLGYFENQIKGAIKLTNTNK